MSDGLVRIGRSRPLARSLPSFDMKPWVALLAGGVVPPPFLRPLGLLSWLLRKFASAAGALFALERLAPVRRSTPWPVAPGPLILKSPKPMTIELVPVGIAFSTSMMSISVLIRRRVELAAAERRRQVEQRDVLAGEVRDAWDRICQDVDDRLERLGEVWISRRIGAEHVADEAAEVERDREELDGRRRAEVVCQHRRAAQQVLGEIPLEMELGE